MGLGREIIFTAFLSYLTVTPRDPSFKIMGVLEEKGTDTSFPNWLHAKLQKLTRISPHTVRAISDTETWRQYRRD